MRLSLFLLTFIFLLSGCITRQSYSDLEAVRDYYKSEAEAVDSISIANQELVDKNRELELQLQTTVRELEELAVANNSLSRNYEEILDKYNQIIKQNENELTTYSYEKISLQEQLAAQQTALDKREKELATMEYELYQKESKLNTMSYDFNNMEGSLSEKNQRIQELEKMLSFNEQSMKDLKTKLNNILLGFSNTDLSVEEKSGKIYVSMSQNLLFKAGSDKIDPKGLSALQKVSGLLKGNQDIDITVEGHTDADGTSDANWDLSVKRATSVVKAMVGYGIDPKKITASGKGEHQPIASNANNNGKALNRRTEIVLSPKLDELYNLINR